jgi:hypothetical protein
MPITYRIQSELNLIILVHTGKVTDEEFFTFYKDLYKNNTPLLSMNHLVDLREADSKSRTSSILRKLAEFLVSSFKALTTYPKVAVVAPKDISFGLARMYEAFASNIPWDFIVFRSIDEALTWLSLPKDLMNDNDAHQALLGHPEK